MVKVIIIAIFIGMQIAVGIYSTKKINNVDDFLLGGRKMGAWLSAIAYGTSYFSAVIFIGYAGGIACGTRDFRHRLSVRAVCHLHHAVRRGKRTRFSDARVFDSVLLGHYHLVHRPDGAVCRPDLYGSQGAAAVSDLRNQFEGPCPCKI